MPLFKRGIAEPEADPAQSDVREHGVRAEVVVEERSRHASNRRRGQPPHAQGTVREPGSEAIERGPTAP
jgi:hypothetical protein